MTNVKYSVFSLLPSSIIHLESIPQRELNQPRRIALRPDNAEVGRIIHISPRRAENYDIEGIDELAAQLNLMTAVGEREVLQHRQVDITVSIAAHIRVVARSISEPEFSGRLENRGVEPGLFFTHPLPGFFRIEASAALEAVRTARAKIQS